MSRPFLALSVTGILLLTAAPAAFAQARPACPLLSTADAARLVGKPVGAQKESTMGAAHYTACRYTADDKSPAAVIDVEVYWQFAKMTFDGYCKGAETVTGVGDAACAAIDTVNVLKGQSVLRVRVPGMASPAWRTKGLDVAKAVLPKL
jgi:hypothetical protein